MEEESFNDVMGHAPVYSSGIPGVSVTNPAEFKEWHGRVRRAHEREVDALRGDTYLDAVSDSVLAKHGLVRLPVDADGVPWTGDEKEFSLPSGEIKKFAAIAYGGGFWDVIDMDGRYSTALSCRHVPDADTPASLADELDIFASTRISDKDAVSMLKDIADRLRERRWRE